MNARDQVDFGLTGITQEVVLDGWRNRGFDPAADGALAEDERGLLGYGAVFGPGVIVCVHPAREGAGAGDAFLRWTEQRVRQRGGSWYRQRIAAQNLAAHVLLQSAGYEHVRSAHYMSSSLTELAPAPPPPDGVLLETVDVDRDAKDLHRLDQLAFAENPDALPELFGSFYDEHLASRNLHPPSCLVARRRGETVGFILGRRLDARVGFVDLLGVDHRERRRGLGDALLLHALHGFADAGLAEARLDVASDNPGALRLYRRAGMIEAAEVHVLEKPV